ncbi:MAG: hypothetical protein Q7J65_07045 [Candidatus Marinimicrobia bacterium]|nr:hypothetical protein [Candidatus Neomarinimicrobiota bacterium]
MGESQLREKLVKEIYLIPLEKLDEVYDFICFFRKGIERTKTNKERHFQRVEGLQISNWAK